MTCGILRGLCILRGSVVECGGAAPLSASVWLRLFLKCSSSAGTGASGPPQLQNRHSVPLFRIDAFTPLLVATIQYRLTIKAPVLLAQSVKDRGRVVADI